MELPWRTVKRLPFALGIALLLLGTLDQLNAVSMSVTARAGRSIHFAALIGDAVDRAGVVRW